MRPDARTFRHRLLQRATGHAGFARGLVSDLEELHANERRSLGFARARLRHWRRMASVLMHFVGGALRGGVLSGATSDFRAATRKWSTTPALALMLVLTLALGIGATAAIFSVVNGVLLAPLPYERADRLVVIRTELPRQSTRFARSSGPELLDLQRSATTLAEIGAVWYRPGALTDDGLEPEDVDMAFVSAQFLPVLGLEPLLGRWPTAAEDTFGAEPVVVLAHETWQRRYGADPAIIGTTISFDDVPHLVVGVMPPNTRMHLPPDLGVPDRLAAWVPWASGYDTIERSWRVFSLLARLRDDATLDQSSEELAALAVRLEEEFPEAYSRSGIGWDLQPLPGDVVAHVRPTLLVLFAAVTLVLIVACANVANLMLSRGLAGAHEAVVRVALGASRWHLFRQSLLEAAMIASAGTVVGLGLALAAIRVLPALAPADLPRLDEVALDGRALAFAALLAGGASVALGLLLVRHSLSGLGVDALKEARSTGTAGARTRTVLVVGQLAFSVVLLVGAGLLIRSSDLLARIDSGYRTTGVVTMKMSLVDSHFPYAEPLRIAAFYRSLVQRVEQLAGVRAAGATSQLPLDGSAYSLGSYAFESAEGALMEDGNTADYRTVTPGWLEAMQAQRIEGRLLEWDDHNDSAAVVVIDDQLAQRAWPDRTAIGQRLRVGIGFGDERDWAQVVGVVRHLRHHPTTVGHEQIYVPHAQKAARTMALTVRSDSDAASLLLAVRELVSELDADQPVQQIRALDEYLYEAVAPLRFARVLLLLTAAVALVLAVVGVYGVVSYGVSRRTRELGLRMAIGASPGEVVGSVVRSGAATVLLGFVVGVPAALAFATTMAGILFGVSPFDPWVYASVAATLSAVTAAACYLPARRASRLHPATALRIH